MDQVFAIFNCNEPCKNAIAANPAISHRSKTPELVEGGRDFGMGLPKYSHSTLQRRALTGRIPLRAKQSCDGEAGCSWHRSASVREAMGDGPRSTNPDPRGGKPTSLPQGKTHPGASGRGRDAVSSDSAAGLDALRKITPPSCCLNWALRKQKAKPAAEKHLNLGWGQRSSSNMQCQEVTPRPAASQRFHSPRSTETRKYLHFAGGRTQQTPARM